MATYALTVSTNDLGLGVLSGARVVVEKRRTQISDIFSGQALTKNTSATNTSGVAVMFLSPDDSSVYHELKIFDLAGIPVYSVMFTMPPQAVALTDLPVGDIISESATQAVAASVTATEQAVISAAQAVIATTQAGIATTQAGIATTQAGLATTNGAAQVDLAEKQAALTAADRVQTAADRVQTGLDRVQTGADVLKTEVARDIAANSAGTWPTTASGVGNGVASTSGLVAGSGGTNGTFALAFSGGTQVLAPQGYFVVAGGAVTSVVITYKGYYSAGTPTISFAASSGLTGASVTAVMAANTPIGSYFTYLYSSGGTLYSQLYKNVAGVATAITDPVLNTYQLIKADTPTGYAWAVTDDDGDAAIGVKNDGTFAVNTIEAAVATATALTVTTLNGAATTNLATAMSSVSSVTPTGYAWAVTDNDNDAAIGVKDDGTFVANAMELTTLNGIETTNLANILAAITTEAPTGYAWAVTDTDGDAAIGVKTNGTVAVNAFETATLNGVEILSVLPAAPIGYLADINHVSSYGQSLSLGYLSTPALSTTQPYDGLMINGEGSAFTPLIATMTGALGENPCSGMNVAIKQLILSENGYDYTQQSYQMLFTSDGLGSTAIRNLSKGSSQYNVLTTSISTAYALAQTAGKSYNYPAFLWVQGESDYVDATALEVYKNAMTSLQTSINAYAKSVTGQANDVFMLSYQTGSHKVYSVTYPTVALAQLAAMAANPKVKVVCPTYFLDYNSGDNVHLTAASEKILGFYMGIAYKRIILDGKNFKPLMPISKYYQSKIAVIEFNPVGSLVLDTTYVAANTNYGFVLLEANDAPITISSVTVLAPNRIRIVAASNITAGCKLQYAFTGAGTSGRTTGPRGNLRDSQGDVLPAFDPSGLNYLAHNWCVMFEEIF